MLEALIVGGGPVGLYLARRLRQDGHEVQVLEARTELPKDSRAIGIHAGALDSLARIGLADPLLEQAVAVRQARVCWRGRPAGLLRLDALRPPHNLVAMHPQSATMQLLDDEPHLVTRGVRVEEWQEEADQVTVEAGGQRWQARWLVAADGGQSVLRERAGILFEGQTYRDVYMMGDFVESTPWPEEAVVYLGGAGLVESFPLPGGIRRWVVKTDEFVPDPTAAAVCAAVAERTRVSVDPATASMLSSFRTHGRIADRFRQGRLLLVGDAAHTVCPIGGQGMNLGWINADRLAAAWGDPAALQRWERQARRTAQRVRRRGEFNMRLGRGDGWRWWRRLVLWGILHPPLRHRFRRAFAMRDL